MFIRATWISKPHTIKVSEVNAAFGLHSVSKFTSLSGRAARAGDGLGCSDARFSEMTRGLFD